MRLLLPTLSNKSITLKVAKFHQEHESTLAISIIFS
jgi:hypothetical protein